MNNNLFFILSLLLFASCLPSAPKGAQDSKPKTPFRKPSDQTSIIEPIITEVSVKRYDQINQTLSSATGVSISKKSIRDIFKSIESTLPLSNDPKAYSAFAQVAFTSLALSYCKEFISSNTSGTYILGVNTSGNPQYQSQLVTKIIERLAYTSIAADPFLQFAQEEMIKEMTIGTYSDDEGEQISIFNRNDPTHEAYQACGLFLSSSYFILDEV